MIFDAHLDLAMNAIEWNRDLTRTVADLRHLETREKLTDRPDRTRGTVSLPDMRRAGIGICVATQIARIDHNVSIPSWRSPAQAWAMTQAQLAWYRAMEECGEMVQIRNLAELETSLAQWQAAETPEEKERLPIGYILSLEGADSIFSPRHLERSYADGLRALGPAHYGPGVYANGTDGCGHLNEGGRALLREADRLGIILDATHLCDEAFWDAMEVFQGPVWASHQNARALVPHMRQFTDEQLRELIARGSVMGLAFDAWMLHPNWIRGETTPQSSGVLIEHAADHVDHICQLAGNARHCGIGTDLDGGYGTEQTPQDLDTIADLEKLRGIFTSRGYSAEDIEGIFWRNYIEFLRNAWK